MLKSYDDMGAAWRLRVVRFGTCMWRVVTTTTPCHFPGCTTWMYMRQSVCNLTLSTIFASDFTFRLKVVSSGIMCAWRMCRMYIPADDVHDVHVGHGVNSLNKAQQTANHCLQLVFTIILHFFFAEECLLDDVRNYRYLTHGNVNCSLDDNELYQELIEAFNIMGLSKDEINGLDSVAPWSLYSYPVPCCELQFLASCSHPPCGVRRPSHGQHAVQTGAKQRTGNPARQHGRAESVPPPRHARHRAHQGLPPPAHQSRTRLRHESTDQGAGTLLFAIGVFTKGPSPSYM